MEIIITIIIACAALFIIYKNIKSSVKGKCNCSNCSKECLARREESRQ